MCPTKSPLNQGIRWPYLNQPCPVRKSGGWLLTNHFTSFTSEAPTVHVRGSYHRERSYCSCPRFALRPGSSRFARSPPTLLIYRERKADYEFHSSPSLGDPQLIGLPPRALLHAEFCLRGSLFYQPSQTQARGQPALLGAVDVNTLANVANHFRHLDFLSGGFSSSMTAPSMIYPRTKIS